MRPPQVQEDHRETTYLQEETPETLRPLGSRELELNFDFVVSDLLVLDSAVVLGLLLLYVGFVFSVLVVYFVVFVLLLFVLLFLLVVFLFFVFFVVLLNRSTFGFPHPSDL